MCTGGSEPEQRIDKLQIIWYITEYDWLRVKAYAIVVRLFLLSPENFKMNV